MHHGNRPAQNQPKRIGVGGVTELEAYIRLYTDVQAMTKNTINREYNNGGLVDGASMYRHDVLQYTTTNALEANDGLDVIGLYKW
jgi:hypothetical protein